MESNSIIENIGLYVHIPFCRSKCRYCGFYSQPVENYDVERLIASVITELDNYKPQIRFKQYISAEEAQAACLQKNCSN